MSVLFLVAALLVRAGAAEVPAPAGKVLYLVAHTTATRAEPDANGRKVSKLKPFDIVSGTEAAPGWLQIELTTGAADAQGLWLAIEPENVVSGSIDALKYRIAKGQQARWPERVRLDVARGRIRCGFTADQVRLALGDPRTKELRHESSEPAEEWSYDTMRVIVSIRGVTEIHPIAQR